MHTLEHYSAVDACKVENALVAKHILSINSRERADIAIKLLRIKRRFRFVDKRVDVIIMMMKMMIGNKLQGALDQIAEGIARAMNAAPQV